MDGALGRVGVDIGGSSELVLKGADLCLQNKKSRARGAASANFGDHQAAVIAPARKSERCDVG
jgi:hypothetical protein